MKAVPPTWPQWARLRRREYVRYLAMAFGEVRDYGPAIADMTESMLTILADDSREPMPVLTAMDQDCDRAVAIRSSYDLRLDVTRAPALAMVLLEEARKWMVRTRENRVSTISAAMVPSTRGVAAAVTSYHETPNL